VNSTYRGHLDQAISKAELFILMSVFFYFKYY
jgi:hypothetical protein